MVFPNSPRKGPEPVSAEIPHLTLLGSGTSMGVPMIGCDCAVCRSTDPRDQRTRCSVHVGTTERGFLIDTSPELRLQVIRERIQRVDAVLFTHAHADHIMGLDDLRVFCWRQQQAIPLYCEEIPRETIRRAFFYAFDETLQTLHSRPRLELVPLSLDPVRVAGFDVQPIRLLHGELPVLGFRVNDIAFCTDVSAIPEESWPHLQGLQVLILGAIRDEPHPTHFTVAQALEVVERARPQHTYLTHISHTLGHAATNARLPPGVEMGFDGLKIPL